MACPIGPALWMPLNLTERFPGYRILDRNTPEYQMEAFMYTCVMLLFYTVATGAFMVKFVLQAREPWESAEGDSSGAASAMPMVAKLRELERHKKLVERQARRDVKMQMINQLRQMSLTSLNLERRPSGGSPDTQVTSFSSDQRNPIGATFSKERRPSVSGSNLMQQRTLTKSNSGTSAKFTLPLRQHEMFVERTYSEGSSSVWPSTPGSPIYAYHPLTRVHSPLHYRYYSTDTVDDTLVSL